MIFVGLFLFITFIVIALNVYNHSNLAYIEEYLQNSNCKEYAYSKGSYKAFCDDYFIEVRNSFSVDIQNNSNIFKYEDIKNIQVNQLNIIINDNYKLSFSQKDELEKFYKNLEEKINK